MIGWIKLHRSLIQWEWYDDINVKVTFIHLLLSANHAPRKWRGIDIGRGQLWTSIGNLAKETGLSEKQIRNCLKKLESTSEIVTQGASNGTMITVCKYDSYQAKEETDGEQMGEQMANDGQTMGEQRATNKNDNNTKNEKERKGIEDEEDLDINKPDLFQIFWNLYGNKVEEVKCQREWFKIDSAEYAKIIEHVPKFVNASGKFLCKPLNYLEGRRWKDEHLPNYTTKEETKKPIETYVPNLIFKK